MNDWLQEIFDKHEIELEFKFIEFKHKINGMFNEFFYDITYRK
jgi:hypothetical protein